jgi:cell division protein FtsB
VPRAKASPGAKLTRAENRRSREARRSRFMLLGGALLSLVILGAWFPASALYHQHSSLASANAALNELHQQDAALAQESKNLSNSAEIDRIAREQYELVGPGQQAYEVLPPTGSSKAHAPYSGDPALSAPVAPSSASVLPPGSETATTQPVTATHSDISLPAASHHHTASTPGMLGRMLGALEFWR